MVRLFVGVGAVEDLLLFAVEPFTAPHQAFVDRFGAGGQAALQHGQGEPDGVLAFAADPVGPVHPFADVGGDLLVEVVFQVGELVGDRLGDPLREEALALESQ